MKETHRAASAFIRVSSTVISMVRAKKRSDGLTFHQQTKLAVARMELK